MSQRNHRKPHLKSDRVLRSYCPIKLRPTRPPNWVVDLTCSLAPGRKMKETQQPTSPNDSNGPTVDQESNGEESQSPSREQLFPRGQEVHWSPFLEMDGLNYEHFQNFASFDNFPVPSTTVTQQNVSCSPAAMAPQFTTGTEGQISQPILDISGCTCSDATGPCPGHIERIRAKLMAEVAPTTPAQTPVRMHHPGHRPRPKPTHIAPWKTSPTGSLQQLSSVTRSV